MAVWTATAWPRLVAEVWPASMTVYCGACGDTARIVPRCLGLKIQDGVDPPALRVCGVLRNLSAASFSRASSGNASSSL